jgi:DNA-binding beta-propeller fold protein YncE
MKKILLLSPIITLFLTSCNVGNRKSEEVEKDSVLKFSVEEQWRTDTILKTPESVIYDSIRNVLYVSNINLEPRMKDENGFISRIDLNGKVTDVKWIEGMSGPKGLAIIDDTLFTADIDQVVVMDINSGKIIRKIPVKGARLLNDITSDGKGGLYISDTDANKIFWYSAGIIVEWLGEGLNGPNGLLISGDSLLLASQGSNDFSSIKISTKERRKLTDSIIHADGLAYTGKPGYYIVSDWNGEVYVINPDNTKTSVLNTKKEQTNSADIEYIIKDSILLVPTFFKNSVVAYKLSSKE